MKLLGKLILISVFCSGLYASEIALSVARSIAERHCEVFNVEGKLESDILVEPESGREVAWLFQLEKGGFIIVANDDHLPPVLGYSFDNPFDNSPDCLPTRIIAQRIHRHLINIDRLDNSWIQQNRDLWFRYLGGAVIYSTMTVYGPLIATHWHQNPPYNDYCPTDPGTGHTCVVGCVGTAMGQLFNYYQWPASVTFTDDDSYWATRTTPDVWVDAPSASIGSINYNGGSPTPDMAARISKAAGVSVQMDYGPYASSASCSPSDFMLKWQYAYCREIEAGSGTFYTDLANSIIAGDPSPMSISYMDGGYRYGHKILVDGYNDATSTYHTNFGWGGSDDGWYVLSTGLPGDYDTVEDAIVDFQVPTFSRLEVPTAYSNIQAALDAAIGGDTVVVMPGTYSGSGNRDLDFNGKWVYLRGEGGFQSVTINLGGLGRFVHFQDEETPGAVVDGFTIQNGNSAEGGAIFIENFSCPSIRNCYFESNNASNYGGAIGIRNTGYQYPRIENCVFTDNDAGWNGGAVNVSFGRAILVNNTITGNNAYHGGGFATCDLSKVVIFNTIFWTNTAEDAGADIWFSDYGYDPCTLYVAYTDFNPSNFSMDPGAGTLLDGGGNINVNPLFLEYKRTDGTSDCVDAGTGILAVSPFGLNLEAPTEDILGFPRPQGVNWDMGAYDYTVAAGIADDTMIPDAISHVYPNPFNGAVRIDLLENYKAAIFDIRGNLVHTLSGGSNIWNPGENISTGVYLIRIDEERTMQRLIYLK